MVMDMAANQAQGAEYMIKMGNKLKRKFMLCPKIDRKIAEIKLKSMGVKSKS